MPGKGSGGVADGSTHGSTNGPVSANPAVGKESERSVDLERWAQLIADGEVSFPGDLAPERAEILRRKVRECMRRRLMRFIARRIAKEIAGGSG